jgi:hypothetical protein
MEEGRRRLRQWKQSFLDGILPQQYLDDKKFSHPFRWTWAPSKKDPDSPCEYCHFGDICREDHKLAVSKGRPLRLEESTGIEAAIEVREEYDLDLVRQAVLARWGVEAATV